METQPLIIASFYHFVPLPDYMEIRQPMKDYCVSLSLKGSILLADEGINATISGTRENIDRFFDYLKSDHRFSELEWKENTGNIHPFGKMKVRLKKELVPLGESDIDLDNKGTYVSSTEWERLLNDPEVTVVDTRNDYEYILGHFKGAVNPETDDFRGFSAWATTHLDPSENKKIAMYCTGGIRCEKATALLKQRGFEDVYHLKGGILRYFKDTHNDNDFWQGKCFVFDERITVDEHLQPSTPMLCEKCGYRITKQVAQGSCDVCS